MAIPNLQSTLDWPVGARDVDVAAGPQQSADPFKVAWPVIYDKEVQQNVPKIGTVSGSTSTIPLYGLRVNWSSVSDVRCPLFSAGNADSMGRN